MFTASALSLRRIVFLLAACSGGQLSAQSGLGAYTITTLCQSCFSSGLNDFGQVTGNIPGSFGQGILWTPSSANSATGSLLYLPGLAVSNSVGNGTSGINNRGQVLGTSASADLHSQLWLWSPVAANSTTGTTTAIPLPGVPTFALNDYGQVEATEQIWTPSVANGSSGTVTLSSQLFQGEIYMNGFGQVLVGPLPYVESQGWLFTPTSPQGGAGTFTSLTGLPGATTNAFTAINAVGTVVGGSCVGCGLTTTEGFVWTPNTPNGTSGTYSQIAAPAGFSYLSPTALNAQGDVVGTMLTPSYQVTPFLYTGGVVYDLTTVSSTLAGATPVAINSLRQILFNYSVGTNSIASYLATPKVIVPPMAPFGVIDTPANNATGIAGAIGITGWALSSADITKVALWRETVEGETACVAQPGGDCLVFIGNATIVRGTRPDVAQSYPGYPNSNSGWGLQVLTNELPNATGEPGVGNGYFHVHALATNIAGQTTDIGTVCFTVDNADSAVPFGTIDTPTPGATESGTFVNFGWVLTPQPNMIPLDGSTITVFIDNLPLGHPVYNNPRVDIETLFPGFANTDGAVGYYYIDTTMLSNGLHSIAWSAKDNAGNAMGLGSRYFYVQN
jgi:hypothetical protein